MRRFENPPDPSVYYEPRAGAYGIILHGSHILLTQQSHPSIGTEIQLPGGGIDPGESPINALHRETYEETGWHIQVLTKLGAYRRFTEMPEYHKFCEKIAHVYLCRATIRLGDPSEPHHTALLANPKQAVNLLGPEGDQYFLNQFLKAG